MLLNAYVKETGDSAVLRKSVRYFDGGAGGVYDHARRGVRFLQDVAKSPRGIPLMGNQDWNDAFDRTGSRGRGESVWLGMGLCVALKELEELATRSGDAATARDCGKRYEKMKSILNRHAWDGSWYLYAFNDFGRPVGSRKNREGRIHLNAQTWAVLAGLPDEERLGKILAVIDKELDGPCGPLLFRPPYRRYDDTIGRITAFAPGAKENASMFCHAAAFKIHADLRLGRGNEAYATLKKILPASPGRDIETYKAEPYVFPEYVNGPGHPSPGEGAFTWLTGSVDWVFMALTEGILGVRPEYDGLRIRPCLPAAWREAGMRRVFRGAVYDIRVHNRAASSGGGVSIFVDGEKVPSGLIRPHGDGKTHKVEVSVNS